MATIPSELIRIKEVLDATNISITDEIEVYEYAAKLQDRIGKALDLLKTLDEDTLSNMQLALEIIGHIEYILRGER